MICLGKLIWTPLLEVEVEPSAIDADSIKCNFLPGNKLRLTWSAPWNGAKVQGYSVWDHNSFREYLTPEAALTLSIDPTKVTQVWIRPKKDDWRGKFTPRVKVLLYASYIWCSNGLLKLIFGHLQVYTRGRRRQCTSLRSLCDYPWWPD